TALLSILVNPGMFKLIPAAERALLRLPMFRARKREEEPVPSPPAPCSDHVVVVGPGRVGEYILKVLHELSIPLLVVERDPARARLFRGKGTATWIGDASDSEILTHAGLPGARAIVVAIPDEVAAQLVVAAARHLAPELPIISRAGTRAGARRLADRGAQAVIQPELEGGLELVRYTLLLLGF